MDTRGNVVGVMLSVVVLGPSVIAACPNYEYETTISVGSPESDDVRAIAASFDGTLVYAGVFGATMDFDPTDAIDLHSSINDSGDIFVSCIFSDGTYGWTRSMGGVWGDAPHGVAIASDGSVFVVGEFQRMVDFDPSDAEDIRNAVGWHDAFLTKYDAAGDYQWTLTFGGLFSEWGLDIVLDLDGNIIIAGFFGGEVDFDPSAEGTDKRTPIGGGDVFLTKLTPDGDYVWTKTWGGADDDYVYDLLFDDGHIYVAGYYYYEVDFDPGEGVDIHTAVGGSDAFVTSLDADGNYLWTWTAGGPLHDYAGGVSRCGDTGVIAVGSFEEGPVDFDPSAATDVHDTNGWYDLFVTKLSTAGDYEWTKTVGGTDGDLAEGVAAGVDGAFHVVGSFGDGLSSPGYAMDFNPDGGDVRHSIGQADIFVTSYDCDGTYLWTYTVGGNQYDVGFAITTSSDGEILHGGGFRKDVDFDPGGGEDIHTAVAQDDIYVSTLSCADALPACDGDVNADGVVDPLDSGYILARFNCSVGTGDPLCDAADANLDGLVDPLDLGYVLSRFGDCP